MAGWRSARSISLLAVAHVLGATGCARDTTPVSWVATLDRAQAAKGSIVHVKVHAKIDPGWYFYSVTQPAGGPIPARIWLSDTADFRPAGSVTGPAPVRSFDRTFGMNVEKYPESSTFLLPVRISLDAPGGAAEIRVSAMYQACNDSICLSPKTVIMAVPVTFGGR